MTEFHDVSFQYNSTRFTYVLASSQFVAQQGKWRQVFLRGTPTPSKRQSASTIVIATVRSTRKCKSPKKADAFLDGGSYEVASAPMGNSCGKAYSSTGFLRFPPKARAFIIQKAVQFLTQAMQFQNENFDTTG